MVSAGQPQAAGHRPGGSGQGQSLSRAQPAASRPGHTQCEAGSCLLWAGGPRAQKGCRPLLQEGDPGGASTPVPSRPVCRAAAPGQASVEGGPGSLRADPLPQSPPPPARPGGHGLVPEH